MGATVNICIGEFGVDDVKTSTCGKGITGDILLPTAADGAVDCLPGCPNLDDTESTLAPKDVLVVTHGVCVVNGATSAIIKCGKVGKA